MYRLLAAISLTITAALGQQPSLTNAQQKTLSASGGLTAAMRTASGAEKGPFWIGYAVPATAGERNSCCWSDSSRGCGLEGQRTVIEGTRPAGPVQLEGPTHVMVLLRIEAGEVGRVRALNLDCPLDAGGLPFYWFTDVRDDQSIAMLAETAQQRSEGALRSKAGEPALHAIAVHKAASATSALEKFATSATSEQMRKSALFWLANARGRAGFEVVDRAVGNDASDKVREHAIFALTQSSEPEAVSSIIRVAKQDKSPHVRGQALFWLAQKASKQAVPAISEALDRDPDTEAKKRAVFALTQLPSGQGVPKLIEIARTHSNPAVKKQAMFWLGQSKDPRALQFFEQVLARP